MTAASRVTRLPDLLVDQIAAGEVIERPAAVVKELVENALDAGAGRISVSLAGGGIDRIVVADDGAGMGADDLALAVQRHCTSKLPGGDLARIATLGFRGEALPSIGAAARLSITTRRAGDGGAWRIAVEGGAVAGPVPVASPAGTTVVVEDLFFATPARRKFLKSARIEAEHAAAALRRLALAAPAVGFRFDLDGRQGFDWPPGTLLERVRAVLGPDGAGDLVAVAHGRDGLGLSGYALAPAVTRPTNSGQFTVVNGRPVTDPVLRTAIRVAYLPLIERGRHAVCALSLEIPADGLDVNVHPAKTELRFRDADAVRALVIGGLGRALGTHGTGMRPGMGAGMGAIGGARRPPLRLVPVGRPGAVPLVAGGGGVTPGGGPGGVTRGFAERAAPFEAVLALGDAPSARMLAPPPAPGAAAHASHTLGAPVAQVLDTYVIAVAADGDLVLVDQHAAHERLTHERLRAEHEAGGVRAQALLLPAVVELPPGRLAPLLDEAAALAAAGIALEPFGPGAVLVRALPAALGAPDPAALVRDIADELAHAGTASVLASRLDAVFARLACHGSIRAGRRLDQAEMSALLRAVEAEPRAATCPHGRPTVVRLSRHDLERMFGRA